MKLMSHLNKVATRVTDISEQIAKGYLNSDDIIETIESDEGILYLSVDGEIISYGGSKIFDPNSIEGFMRGKVYKNFEEFKSEIEYSKILSKSDYDQDSIFPIVNLKTTCVSEQNQGKGIGTRLMSRNMRDAAEQGHYPIITRMWRKANHHNNHIKKAKQLGGTIIGENDSFLEDFKCEICNEHECGCSESIVVIEKSW